MSRIRILVASRLGSIADAIETRLNKHPNYAVTTKIITNGHIDPLQNVPTRPDLLLLHYSPGSGELEFLAEQSASRRIPLIVFGPANDPEAMRLAMRAGASDFLPEPLSGKDLAASLERTSAELSQKRRKLGRLLTFVNSKGGSGASFLATNLACLIHREKHGNVTLVDLDLQFGGLAKYLDLTPQRGLLEALADIDDMDAVAADAYVTKHKTGLKLLAAPSESLTLPKDVPPDKIDALLQLFLANSDFVIADLPRRIDNLTATVLERSDQLVLVVQQSLAHVHDAARMIQLMIDELAISRERILVVINRFDKNSIIELNDIRKALKIDSVTTVPNQYKAVVESVDAGIPLVESARHSSVGRAIEDIERMVTGRDKESDSSRSFLRRALPGLLRRT